MADNIALKNDDSTTIATLRTDDIGGVQYPTTKITIGADGSDGGFVSSANPLPISDAGGSITVDGTVAVTGTFWQATQPVSGTVAATQSGTWNVTNISGTVSLPTGAATSAKQSDGSQKTQVVDGSGNVMASTSNALHVRIASSAVTFGATEYTQDAAAAANPVGPMNMAVRTDSLASIGSDGDNVAVRATAKGEVYVKQSDSVAITAASLPLPTGAATAAKQPALGTAGTPSTDVITVQGRSGMTALLVDGSAVTQPVSDGGGSLSIDDGGNVITVDGTVTLGAGSAVVGKVSIDQTTPGTTNLVALAANQSVNQTQIGGASVSTGNGSTDSGTQRVTLSNDGTGVIATVGAVTAVTNWGNIVDNAGFTDGTTRLSMSGFIYDDTAGTALTENDAAAARIDAKRAMVGVIEDATTRGQRAAVGSDGSLQVRDAPATAGGLTVYKRISTASTNAAVVKNAAGQLYSVTAWNTNAAARYLKFYNSATSPTVGTDVPVATFLIPGNTAGAGVVIPIDKGLAFATGISIAITTGAADTDTGATGASECGVVLGYK